MNKYVRIIIAIVVCLGLGFASSKITQSSLYDWYPEIKKPVFNPPNSVFAPVWTLLFILMGLAAGMIWNQLEKQTEAVKKALFFFCVQLLFNVLWTFLFFGLNNLLLASIEIVLLWLLIYETFILFKKIEPKAAYLLLPYLAWVAFASVLTFFIYYLNI